MTRQVVGHIAVWAMGIGAFLLAILMAWSVWRLHGFSHLFWLWSFMFILICFLIRNQFARPPAAPWNVPLVWFATALAVAIGGALASPALNAWMRG